jgi:hypothetical protein
MALPVPSPAQPFVDHRGVISREWLQFLLQLARLVAVPSAPVDAAYLVSTPDPVLTNERVATSSVSIQVDLGTAGLIRWNLLSTFGDVTGPASSVNSNIAIFSGITGKVIADSGQSVASILATALAAAIAAIVPIDLASEVFGDLPFSNITPSADASRLLGRGAASAGDWQPITLGTGLAMTGTTLSATFSGVVVDVAGALDGDGTIGSPLAVKVDGVTIQINGSNELEVIGGGGGGSQWSVLTNGDVVNPELIFAGGDVVMLETP